MTLPDCKGLVKEPNRMRTFSAWTTLIAGTLAATGLLGGCGNAVAPPPPAAPKAPVASSKADPPLDIELVFVADPDAAKPGRLTVAVTSHLDLPDVEVTVRLPDGLEAPERAPAWHGRIERSRQQRTHAIAIRTPDARRYDLTVTATALLEDGTRVTRVASLAINPDAAPDKPSAPAGEIKTNSRGEKILEMPAGPSR